MLQSAGCQRHSTRQWRKTLNKTCCNVARNKQCLPSSLAPSDGTWNVIKTHARGPVVSWGGSRHISSRSKEVLSSPAVFYLQHFWINNTKSEIVKLFVWWLLLTNSGRISVNSFCSEATVSNCKMLISYNNMFPMIDESCQWSAQEVWGANLSIADRKELGNLKPYYQGHC